MKCKILRLFVNTLTAYDKYSMINRDTLTQPIQMELPPKEETFCDFFSEFLNSALRFKYFQKKDDSHSWCISEIMHSENCG